MADYEIMDEDEVKESREVIQKYVVIDSVASEACILKFHMVQMELTIGGYAVHFEFIQYIINDFVLAEGPIEVSDGGENLHTQRNKVKYVFNMKKVNFAKLIDRIEHGSALEVHRIKSHGRMI